MKRKRFSEEQIIAILREHEAGVSTADLCRKHGMSSASFYAWKAKYGGMDVSDAQKLQGPRGGERQAEAAFGRRDARQCGAERSARKKMVTPAQRREAVAHLQDGASDERAAGVPGRRRRSRFGALSGAQARRWRACALGSGRWRMSAGASAIAGCTSCCAARAGP